MDLNKVPKQEILLLTKDEKNVEAILRRFGLTEEGQGTGS